MSRSVKKGPHVDQVLFEKVMNARASSAHMPIKVWNRACTVVPEFVGTTFDVHNGRTFTKVYITEEMVGHKLGEFAPTRQFRSHTGAKR